VLTFQTNPFDVNRGIEQGTLSISEKLGKAFNGQTRIKSRREMGGRAVGKFKMMSSMLAVVVISFMLVGVLSTNALAKKYKVYLSMSYIGNEWQNEAENMVKAMAKHYRDKIDFHIEVSGPNVAKQIQQINSMVQAGADAIIVYPISPTGLNQAIENAIKQGVIVCAYDSQTTAKGAYNFSQNQYEQSRFRAQYVADQLNHKGNVIGLTGVPGTTVDTEQTKAFHDIMAKYPDMHVIAEANGMWSLAVTRQKISELVATNGWDKIQGAWVECGCSVFTGMQLEAGISPDKLRPCGGESTNQNRIQMLKPGTVKGVSPVYRPVGAPHASAGSPVYAGALALKMAVKALEGGKIESNTNLPITAVDPSTVRLCKSGTWQEMAGGCNCFDPSLVPVGFYDAIYSPLTPEVGLKAALHGEPE